MAKCRKGCKVATNAIAFRFQERCGWRLSKGTQPGTLNALLKQIKFTGKSIISRRIVGRVNLKSMSRLGETKLRWSYCMEKSTFGTLCLEEIRRSKWPTIYRNLHDLCAVVSNLGRLLRCGDASGKGRWDCWGWWFSLVKFTEKVLIMQISHAGI